jgi:hypothetical protein
MLFMIIEHFRNGDPRPVYNRFRERGRLAPAGLTYISSWVTDDYRCCYQVMETEDVALLEQWMANWRDIVDFEVIPVVTSAQAVELAEHRRSHPRGVAAGGGGSPVSAKKAAGKKTSSRNKGVTFAEVCKLALELPGVARSMSWGTAALKVDGKMFARLREDGETLVLKMDLVSRDLVIKAQPKIFFITDHYRDWPYVLVRMSGVRGPQMRELLEDSWRLAAPKKRQKSRVYG